MCTSARSIEYVRTENVMWDRKRMHSSDHETSSDILGHCRGRWDDSTIKI